MKNKVKTKIKIESGLNRQLFLFDFFVVRKIMAEVVKRVIKKRLNFG